MPRTGSSAPQFELAKERMTVARACERLVEDANIACEHWARTRWSKQAQRLSLRHLGSGAIHATSDFAATVALTAKETETCSHNNYAILNNTVVSHSPRELPLLNVEGVEVGKVRVVTTDVWFFWGPTKSKCKLNDSVFHNACLDHITEHYKEEFRENDRTLTDVYLWTDNCFSQYRGRKNLLTITKFYEKHKVHLHHSFAEVGQFKGPHDSAGKVMTSEIKKRTGVGDDHAPDAEQAFLLGKKFKEHPSKAALFRQLESGPFKDIERLQRVKGQRGFGHDEYYHGFVTPDKDQWERLEGQHQHVLFTDRTSVADENITAIPNNKKFRDFRSTVTPGILQYRNMPCRCEACRDNRKCPREHFTGAWRTLKMHSSTSKDALSFKVDSEERQVEKTMLEGGQAYVTGQEGKKKSLNANTVVVVRDSDGGPAKVGVIGGGGSVLFYDLDDGEYKIPATKGFVYVPAPQFVAATVTGKRGQPEKITPNAALLALIEHPEEEVEEEVELAGVVGVGPGGAGDDDESDEEEDGSGDESSGGESESDSDDE